MLAPIIKARNYLKALKDGQPGLQVLLVSDDIHLKKSQRLHAGVYLGRGYIADTHIGADGRMTSTADPHQAHSQYFAVVERDQGDDHVVATARQIMVKKSAGHNSFPTLEKLKIFPEARAKLEALPPEDCIEISALAKEKGYSSFAVLSLYRAMWLHSLAQKHKVWIMACDAGVYANLKFLFGPALTEIGKETYYMGSNVVPAMLELEQSLKIFQNKSKYINPVRRKLNRELRRFFLEAAKEEGLLK